MEFFKEYKITLEDYYLIKIAHLLQDLKEQFFREMRLPFQCSKIHWTKLTKTMKLSKLDITKQ